MYQSGRPPKASQDGPEGAWPYASESGALTARCVLPGPSRFASAARLASSSRHLRRRSMIRRSVATRPSAMALTRDASKRRFGVSVVPASIPSVFRSRQPVGKYANFWCEWPNRSLERLNLSRLSGCFQVFSLVRRVILYSSRTRVVHEALGEELGAEHPLRRTQRARARSGFI